MKISDINNHLYKGFSFYSNKSYVKSFNEFNIAIRMIERYYSNNYTLITSKLYDLSVLFYKKDIYTIATLFIKRAIYLCDKYVKDDILIIQLYEKYADICIDGNDIYSGYSLYNQLITFSEIKGYTDNIIKYKKNIHIILTIIKELNEIYT